VVFLAVVWPGRIDLLTRFVAGGIFDSTMHGLDRILGPPPGLQPPRGRRLGGRIGLSRAAGR
jgi:hypothetical protein